MSRLAVVRGNLSLLSLTPATVVDMETAINMRPGTRWAQMTKGRQTATGLKTIKALQMDTDRTIKVRRTVMDRTTKGRRMGTDRMIKVRQTKGRRLNEWMVNE